MRAARTILLISILFSPVLLSLLGLIVGTTGLIPPGSMVRLILHPGNTNSIPPVLRGILRYRLLRTLAAVVVGASLGASGLTYQYALRNPLADPYLLGVSTGSAFGVVLWLYTGHHGGPFEAYMLSLAFGILSFAVVAGIGYYTGGSPAGLIVAGVSVSYTFLGLIVILLARLPGTGRVGFNWLFGTVAYPLPREILYTALILAASMLGLILLSPRLYTLILSDKVSESMGAEPRKTRIASLTLASMAAAGAVALSGPVGFIGLAAPWISRLTLGSNYTRVLAASTALGASLAVGSDILVRLIAAGSGEIPLTAVTALYGGPILYYLSRRTGW